MSISPGIKKKVVYAGRLMVATAVLTLYVYGYVCYERTIVSWWWPVVVSAIVALLSALSISGYWRWLTGTNGHLNALCHIYVVGGICYFLILGGNCHLPTTNLPQEEKVIVLEKKTKVRHMVHRAGSRYRYIKRNVHHYYMNIHFADGHDKWISVQLTTYNRARKGMPYSVTRRQGFWGFPVISVRDD